MGSGSENGEAKVTAKIGEQQPEWKGKVDIKDRGTRAKKREKKAKSKIGNKR